MPTINAGASAAVSLPAGDVMTGTGAGSATYGIGGFQALVAGDAWQIGPFDKAVSVSLSASSAITYTVGDLISGPTTPADFGLSASQVSAVQALVSAAGNPTDLLTGAVQRVTITGAISTTATQAAAATGTYYKARVVWNNNGASGTAKLRIAVNADNDVHGLMIGQSAKRRDYEMTMGDGVMLVCGVPITRLTFSADGAITGGTHQLQVTFGN